MSFFKSAKKNDKSKAKDEFQVQLLKVKESLINKNSIERFSVSKSQLDQVSWIYHNIWIYKNALE